MRRISLDHAATTPINPQVLEAMIAACALPGNPSAAYASGREARRALEQARAEVAQLLNVQPGEVFFTSGGTESDNWALRGMAEGTDAQVIVSAIEHHAVLESAVALKRHGKPVAILPVSSDGVVELDALRSALAQETALVSVMTANNETGALQPVGEISAICRSHGVPFHTDAVQAVGSIPTGELCAHADLLSLSGHKFNGPKGVGILFVRKGTKLHRMIEGGAQERGLRAGTENIPGAVGFAAALRLAEQRRKEDQIHIAALRDRLEAQLFAAIPGLLRNGDTAHRLAGHSNLCFPVRDGRALLVRLDMAGVECSAGSACASGSMDPSHVLLSMGLTRKQVQASLRFSIGRENTAEEIDEAAHIMIDTVKTLSKE